jgi:hypothetical protein
MNLKRQPAEYFFLIKSIELNMALFQKRIQKRRMPKEKIANFVSVIAFNQKSSIWLPQFESILHKILRYEFYLDKVPDNLALPKYRTIIIKIIFRMLNQASKDVISFSKDIQHPDIRIIQILEYIKGAEQMRKEALYVRHPITTDNTKTILVKLKDELEI